MRRHRRRDDGVVLVIAALSMVALLLVTAIVIDLGYTRSDRRNGQLAVDNAASSAGQALATGTGADACATALDYLRLSLDTPAFTGASCGTFTPACVEGATRSTTATSGDYTVTLVYPVVDSSPLMARTSTIGASGIAVDPTIDGTSCQRFGVKVTTTSGSFFGGIAGQDTRSSSAHAVVRGAIVGNLEKPPAFLMLERTDCGVLGNSASGAGNRGIVVKNNGDDAGLIHLDSNATTNCFGSTQDAYAIYGSPLSDGSPSITVEPGDSGEEAQIRTAATNGKGAAEFPGGISVAPTFDDPVSRKIVDEKYNSGASTPITALHNVAGAEVRKTGTPVGHDVIACDGTITLASPLSPSTKAFVDCASFNRMASFVGYTTVVFSDSIDLKKDNVLQFPAAETVVVRGRLAIPKGRVVLPKVSNFYVGGGVAISNGSGLAVNSTTETNCSGREGPAWSNTTRFAIFGGDPAFDSSGAVAMCQTTIYLAGPKSLASSGYAIQQTTTGGTCTSDKPCPKLSGNIATGAQFFFGGGTTNWSAPNQSIDPIKPPELQGLEDLAMWTEGAGESQIKSGAVVRTIGVLFAPNASYQIQSPASGLPVDAQFIARKLFMNQGTLLMKPDARNSVTIDAAKYSLIR